MILDKLDTFKYKTYNNPVWLSYLFTREFYFGIALWLRTYKAYEKTINGVNGSCSETIMLWVPFFKFTFQFEYEINPETNKPYLGQSPGQEWLKEFETTPKPQAV